mmetsp:Transcript_31178/g.92977  ORF Transcript_31178/g.92977 Transcript_31178/m.92977 type:complete len:1354 (-) Transcript_31178:1870-5931(-)
MPSAIRNEHTRLGLYTAVAAAALCAGIQTWQSLLSRLHMNRKYYVLFGALCFFAYTWARPYIRSGFGSASRGVINFHSLYIMWLCSAVFYHLPSLEALGLDAKADTSLAIAVFIATLTALGVVHGVHELGGVLGLWRSCVMSARRYQQVRGAVPSSSAAVNSGDVTLRPSMSVWHVASLLLLNSATITIACTTFHSFCGNGGAAPEWGDSLSDLVRQTVCGSLLRPIPTALYPEFSAWMLSGEPHGRQRPANTTLAAGDNNPVDLLHLSEPIPPPQLSPVMTVWLTALTIYLTNCITDLCAARAVGARDMSEVRAATPVGVAASAKWTEHEDARAARQRQRDADAAAGESLASGRPSAFLRLRRSSMLKLRALPVARRTTASAVTTELGGDGSDCSDGSPRPAAIRRAGSKLMLGLGLKPLIAKTSSSRALSSTAWPAALFSPTQHEGDRRTDVCNFMPRGAGAQQEGCVVVGSADARPPAPSDDAQDAAGREDASSEAQPEFLPMVPWYSGTSADLVKTVVDLTISLKVFLGRFDMRMMQVATSTSPSTAKEGLRPGTGDHFTYEHLSQRSSCWVDFIADTGDGGDSTYSVARALAAPMLAAVLPPENDTRVASSVPRGPAVQHEDFERLSANTKNSLGAQASSYAAAAGKLGPASQDARGRLLLPRGDMLLIGGDLCYPNPTRDTYEARLFRPFEDAMPPPPQYHPERLVLHKPDLPRDFCTDEDRHGSFRADSGRSGSSNTEALHSYRGPTAFAIPGNHDWIDGLYAFMEVIMARGWLGGWLLPQEKSYFALKLPAGWWVFGLDLGLAEDIDIHQYSYFASVVESRLGPNDQVMLMTHQPLWLLDWYWREASGLYLRQLVRGHLNGRARVHLAGDLHFYMRHSYTEPPAPKPADGAAAAANTTAALPRTAAAEQRAAHQEDDEHCIGSFQETFCCPPTALGADIARGSSSPVLHPGCVDGTTCTGSMAGEDLKPEYRSPSISNCSSFAAGSSNDGHESSVRQVERGGEEDGHNRAASPFAESVPYDVPKSDDVAMAAINAINGSLPTHGSSEGCLRRCASPGCDKFVYGHRQRHPLDPDHLICNGAGGAFLHPTHLFAGAAFHTPHDAAAEATTALYAGASPVAACLPHNLHFSLANGSQSAHMCGRTAGTVRGASPPPRVLPRSGSMRGSSPPPRSSRGRRAASSRGASPPPLVVARGASPQPDGGQEKRARVTGPAGSSDGVGNSGASGSMPNSADDCQYVCHAAYPSPSTSLRLGRGNLHLFRLFNTRFDVVGGIVYFLLVVSIIPRCRNIAEILDSDTVLGALQSLLRAYVGALHDIVLESYLSLVVVMLLLLFCYAIAKAGVLES